MGFRRFHNLVDDLFGTKSKTPLILVRGRRIRYLGKDRRVKQGIIQSQSKNGQFKIKIGKETVSVQKKQILSPYLTIKSKSVKS